MKLIIDKLHSTIVYRWSDLNKTRRADYVAYQHLFILLKTEG